MIPCMCQRLGVPASAVLALGLAACSGDLTRPDGAPLNIPDRVEEVRLSRDSIEVLLLGEGRITARTFGVAGVELPHMPVTWRSEDAHIAVVEEGRVYGKRPGSTRVVAESGEASASALVTVVHRHIVAFDAPAVLRVGETYRLPPPVVPIDHLGERFPDYPMLFTAADTSIAEVDALGRLVGKRPGETEVVARAAQASVTIPVRVERAFRLLVPSRHHGCALGTDGRAYCWGTNETERPRLGIGAVGDATYDEPQPVAGDQRFVQLTVGEHHSCGVTSAGEAYCWGWGEAGRLGTGSDASADVPTRVVGSNRFGMLSVGNDYTCGIDELGHAWCWGRNRPGVLGQDPGTPFVTEPVRVLGQRSYFATFTTGASERSCGMPLGGVVHCWGSTGLFESAEPDLCQGPACYVPVRVTDLPQLGSVQGAHNHACGATFEGWTYCWGAQRRAAQPLNFRLDLLGPAGMADTLCGIRAGVPYCWSWADPWIGPTALAGGLTMLRIASGWRRACGTTTGGAAYCWENPLQGGAPSPVAVPEE